MDGTRGVRRRQLANLYQAGNEDALLRRHRPRTRSKPTKSRVCRDKEAVREEKEKALHGSIAETLQYGQRRAWHYGYQNEPGLSGSCPLAAASRYGAKGTLRMLRRSASASRVGTNPDEDTNAEGFEVDEWTPMLRCSTSPSLATMTTPKAWPETATYPHGSHPKRMQPSPWYDGETTANDGETKANGVHACNAGSGMRRVAASHSYTMSILQRNALLENASMGMVPVSAPPGCLTGRPTAASSKGLSDKRTHVRTPKRVNQEMGFLRGGTLYMTAPKDPLKHGLTAALEAKLIRQTDQDGLKWSLLKQVLKVITGSQRGLPLQAVKEVAASFSKTVGTSRLATKAQFIDNITGNHVGFPESELNTLFGFFRSNAGGPTATTPNKSCKGSRKGLAMQRDACMPGAASQPKHAGGDDCGVTLVGADWTVAVACMRLLAKPKDSVLSAVLGVFDVFARARGGRTRHQQRLEREKLERERQKAMEEERERWKRRRRQQKDPGNFTVPETHSSPSATALNKTAGTTGGNDDYTRASLAETVRMFTLVCSNEEERHAVTTTYRHRFRLELRAVMQERRNPRSFTPPCGQAGNDSGGGGRGRGGGGNRSSVAAPAAPRSLSPPPRSSNRATQPRVHPSGARTLSPARRTKPKTDICALVPEAFPVEKTGLLEGREAAGVTAEEFSEALVRCPEMLEAFGSQLAARIRHRHRPAWMAPILRKGW